jgi:uncharacterized protein (DUF885 family)
MRLALASLIPTLAFLCACADEPPPVSPAPPLASAAPAAPAPAAPSWDVVLYRTSIEEGIEALLVADPVWATATGEHRFDDQLPDLTPSGQTKIAADFQARAQGLRALAANVPADASPADGAGTDHPALDARLLADHLEAWAFEATSFRPLERDPSRVLTIIGESLTALTDHEYAPKHARIDALATRLAHVPALLDIARARLKQPSHAALENLGIVAKGLAAMLRGGAVDEWKEGLSADAPLQARVGAGAKAAAAAIDAYTTAVQKDFPLASAKDTVLGAATWSELARLREGAAESPAEIRAMGEKELARLLGELDALVAQSGRPKETRAAFFARLEKETPPADGVLAEYRAVEKRVEGWMHDRAVVTVPWEKVSLVVVPTPPYQRGVSFASMNTAGPLDQISDARLEVNEPEPSMPAARRAALLRFNALVAVDLVALHEGFPGHYLQSLFDRAAPSKLRKIGWTASFGEGWAHYCEQMAFENGYPATDPVRMHAFYLRMALQRAARVVVDVGENDGSLSLEDGAKFLEKNAMLAPEAAKIEARRAVVWPAGMFVYTYGKLAILRMRDTVRAREGASFDLRRFHDHLLAGGAMPVKTAGQVAFGLE